MASPFAAGLLGAVQQLGSIADRSLEERSKIAYAKFLDQLSEKQEQRRHGLDLDKAKTAHGYDLDRQKQQQSHDLTRLDKQHGLSMAELEQQNKYAMSRQGASDAAAMARTREGRRQTIADAEGNLWNVDPDGKLSPVERPMSIQEYGEQVGPLLPGETVVEGYDEKAPPVTQVRQQPKQTREYLSPRIKAAADMAKSAYEQALKNAGATLGDAQARTMWMQEAESQKQVYMQLLGMGEGDAGAVPQAPAQTGLKPTYTTSKGQAVTLEKILATAKNRGMTPEQVIQRLGLK